MNDHQLLAAISFNRGLSRSFHRLSIDQRKAVIAAADGNDDEKVLRQIIRKVKKTEKANGNN